ncbi:glycosyltransferase family 39 protein [Sandarakinorhabdus sp. DWP1-3-1]|uniref:glycosyltransferase family 39 protein n=1 Tax=Sandarakinorhabdus sp. DWP1-3-1 TaxID=2804627 RepID=UPI003CEAE5E6
MSTRAAGHGTDARSVAEARQRTRGLGWGRGWGWGRRRGSVLDASAIGWRDRVLAMGVVVALVGLFARIMRYPLRHDEQMYLPVGAMLGQGDMYRDFGFNNFPNLPWLLHLVYGLTGTHHYLLAGRLVIFGGWLLAALAIAAIAWRASRSIAGVALAVLALVTNPLLLGPPGMIVSNNFLPIAFALLAILAFVDGVDRPVPDRSRLLAAGLCLGIAAGFKANTIYLLPPFALAALLLPVAATWAVRWRRVTMPFVVGGLVGAAPLLGHMLADPAGFIAHTVGYHRGPHMAYWAANAALDGEKILTAGGKLRLAETAWLSGPSLLLLLCVILLALAARRPRTESPSWPVLLVAALSVGAVLVSFVPTPAFPQYYAAPVPLGIALAALLYQRIDPAAREALVLPLRAGGVLLLVTGAPRLLADLPALAQPSQWTGLAVHAEARRLAGLVGSGKVATLAPIHPLEAGLAIYPELAAGPLAYRIGDLIPAPDRRHYARLVSPTTITGVLARDPPQAILVGQEGDLDAPFEAFAKANGYRRVPRPLVVDRHGALVVWLQPPRD